MTVLDGTLRAMSDRPPRTTTGFPDDDFDPLKQWREQQEALDRALDPMKQWRKQQEALDRALDPMKQWRKQQEALDRALDPMKQWRKQQEVLDRALDPMKQWRKQQEAIARALSPLRSVSLDQGRLLAHGGAISFFQDPLAAWRQQQMALRSVVDPLAQWRVSFRDALGLAPALRHGATELPLDPIAGLADALDDDSVRALGEFQSGLIDQTVGPLLDAIVDETDDETLFRAALDWATSHPWRVVHYYLEVWLKALEWLTAGGTATAAVAGDPPSTALLLVLAFIVCTGEFLLVLTRPSGRNGGDID